MNRLSRALISSLLFFVTHSFAFGDPATFTKINVSRSQVFVNPFAKPIVTISDAIQGWAYLRSDESKNGEKKEVPFDTGRGFLIPSNPNEREEILVKGTGINEEYSQGRNSMRYSTKEGDVLNFDGKFKTREAVYDFINSEILESFGVKVGKPLGWISLGPDEELKADRAIYAREFLKQTRLSNVIKLSTDEKIQTALSEIDSAIEILNSRKTTMAPLNRVRYFYYLLDRLAKTTAILQRLGFQHGYYHSQQFTLAGELCDLGTGTWKKYPSFNSWSKTTDQAHLGFLNQPLLALNMLYRTHALSSENPEPLKESSTTIQTHAKSLYSVFLKGDPKSALEIRKNNPIGFFWDRFETYYQTIDAEKCLETVDPNDWVEAYTGEKGYSEARLKLSEDAMAAVKNKIKLTYARRMNGLTDRDYHFDQTALESGAPEEQRLKRERQEKMSLPNEIWGYTTTPHSELKAFVDEFSDFVRDTKIKYGDLATSDALLSLRLGIFSRVEVGVKTKLEMKELTEYVQWNQERYETGKPLSDLLKWKVGECHDSALLVFLLGKELERQDSRFTIRILDSEFQMIAHHYFTVLSFKNQSWLIESIDSDWKRKAPWVGPLSYFTSDWSSLLSPIHVNLKKALVPNGSQSNLVSRCRNLFLSWFDLVRASLRTE